MNITLADVLTKETSLNKIYIVIVDWIINHFLNLHHLGILTII